MQSIPTEWMEVFRNPANRILLIDVANGISITTDKVVQDSVTIDRASASGQRFEIGAAIASELTFTLNNADGYYDDKTLEGTELTVMIGVPLDSDAIRYIRLGYFTIDSPPRKLTTINISALDRMVHLDKSYDSALVFPATVREIYHDALDNCNLVNGVTATELNALPNIDYIVSARPEMDGLTYRQIMQWVAEITGTVCYVNQDGLFRLASPPLATPADAPRITAADRFASDLQEQDITFTGVQVDTEDEAYLVGAEGYVLKIEGNALIQGTPDVVASALGAAIVGFTYRPFTCEASAMPQLWPMDPVVFVDKNGTEHPSIVTNICLKFRGHCSLAAKGETATRAGYAAANPLTKGEQLILSKMNRATNARLDSAALATFHLNQMIGGSLGLYATDVVEEDGSTTHYWHDASTLEESSTIYTFGAGGYAWTTSGWNDGSPVWNYGVDKNGNAVYNALYAYKITADMIKVDSLQAICAKIGGWSIGENYIQSEGAMAAGGKMTVSLRSYSGDTTSSALEVTDGSVTFFAVNYDGSMLATKADITGKITAEEGVIGGWSINSSTLSTGGQAAAFTIASADSDAENWIAATYGGKQTFRVSKTGVLTATGVDISGKITATDGSFTGKITADEGAIGGWTINSKQLSTGGASASFLISSASGAADNWISASYGGVQTFKVSKLGEVFAAKGTIGGWTIGETYLGTTVNGASFYIASATDTVSYWIRTESGTDTNFSVSREGVLTATGANISGAITAKTFKAVGADDVYQATMTATGFRVQDNTDSTTNGYIELRKAALYAVNAVGYSFALNGATRLTITDSGGSTVGTWLNTSAVADASDETFKHDINTLPEVYSAVFDALRPVVFKYNDGSSERYHTGLIAQEVEQAVLSVGLTTQNFAAFIRDNNGRCWLRYGEFVAINIAEIQKLKARVAELERMVSNG